MTFDNLIKGQSISLFISSIAILIAIFLLWKVYSVKDQQAKSWLRNKGLILSIAMFLILRAGFSLIKIFDKPNVQPYSPDFFLGVWADSAYRHKANETKLIIFQPDHHFVSVVNGKFMERNMTYKFRLDKTPIEVEIKVWRGESITESKTEIGTIEVIDETHINWTLSDEKGNIIESGVLVKAPPVVGID